MTLDGEKVVLSVHSAQGTLRTVQHSCLMAVAVVELPWFPSQAAS